MSTNMQSYTEIIQRQRGQLQHQEVPIGHAVSLPMPTLRWGQPAYASFASPAHRVPGQPISQDVPDRWWIIDAANGHLMLYALTKVQSFSNHQEWTTQTLPNVTRTMAELNQAMLRLRDLMTEQIPLFFAGEPGDPLARQEMGKLLPVFIAGPLLAQYRALTPDFFQWLNA